MRKFYCLLTLIGSIAVLGSEVFAQAGSANQASLSNSTGGTLPPTITSFTPMSGPIGTAVTITGTNFSTTPSDNIVYFGAVRATVTSASNTALTAIAPVGATYQPITVTTNGLMASTAVPFVVTFPTVGVIDPSSFAPKIDFVVGTNAETIGIADFDGDGMSDVAIVHNDTVFVLRNTSTSGSLSFGAKVDFAVGSYASRMAIGDLDGDGKLDISVTKYVTAGSDSVLILCNTSTSGAILFAEKVSVAVADADMVVIGDLDLDGKPDVAIQGNTEEVISVLQNTTTSASISFAPEVPFSFSEPLGFAIGHLNMDAKPDLVVTTEETSWMYVSRNTSTMANLTFVPSERAYVADWPRSVTLGDLDVDGRPDLAVPNSGEGYINDSTISVLRNISTSDSIIFAEHQEFFAGRYPGEIAIGDLDGDGKPDLAFSNNDGLTVLHNTSASGNIFFDAKVDVASVSGQVAIADLDGDGKPDLVVGTSTGVSVLRNLTDAPVPIQLASFSATVMSQSEVRVEWSTFTEINNYGFEVEKSSGTPIDYETISNSFVPGHGTTNVPQHYDYNDVTAVLGTWYYRLKQIDLDGTVHYTDGIQVDVLTDVEEKSLPKEFALDQNYPNPFNPSTAIQFALPMESHVQLEIFNLLGERIVTLVNETRQAGYYSEQFDATGLASGLYLYRLQARASSPNVGELALDPSSGTGQNFVATKKLLVVK